MIIECTKCHTRFQYDEERFERRPSKKIKCAKCGTIFKVDNPAYPGNEPPARPAPKLARPQQVTDKSPPAVPPTDKMGVEPELPADKRLSLAVIKGADVGTVYQINKPRIIIGRAESDLILNDTEVSRQHAALEIRDRFYILEDLQSSNGTFVDGHKITEPVELQNNEEFQIGTTALMLIATDETKP